VTKIQGPPKIVSFFGKQGRIVRVAVKESSIPVAIIAAENFGRWFSINGRVRFTL